MSRCLTVLQVSERLGLSYTNMKSLHKQVDSMTERAGAWKTEELSFPDIPNQCYTICYRDPIEAIRTLWRDPSLSPHLVYSPTKVYGDESETSRIYSEMWTGQWWHVMQVCLALDPNPPHACSNPPFPSHEFPRRPQ